MYKPFDAKPNFPQSEQEVQDFWQKNDTFKQSLQKNANKEPFVFFEGPPTANGMPGIHHVLARAFKDAVCRFQTMRGKYVGRKAGWDTHGLPVELQVEKQLGISGKKDIENIVPGNVYESIAKFNALCKESVWQFKSDWEKMTERMAYWVDMSDAYVTYDPKYIESVWWLLSELYKKDLVYQGHKVVPYCPRCGTALSSHEVAQGYEDVTEPSVYVKFKLKPDQPIGDFITDNRTYILSWTTTPWTLPGNLALAVGKDIDYVKVQYTSGRPRVRDLKDMNENDLPSPRNEFLILAKERFQKFFQNDHIKPQIIKTFKSEELVGLEYKPLFPGAIPNDKLNDKAFKVYTADFVTTEDGTGVVHTAVMYGEEDYELGEKVGLPKFHTVDETGKFVNSVPAVGGKLVKDKETNKAIFDYLESKNYFLKSEDYTHTYPLCWRCGTALLYYARNSWYIKMSGLRDKLIKNNSQIHWEPEHIKEGRFGEWLREVKDWAISRERYWGTPLPFWKCVECGNLRVVSQLSELSSVDIDPHRPYIDEIVFACEKCKGEQRRVPEVLDVWFDSGAMPYAQWHYPFENKEFIDDKKHFPADYISEAVDQTRGWFYTLIAISTALDLGPAFRQAICVGHIMDEKGQKMSKSKGNIVDHWEVFNNYGADAVRWYFFTVNQPGDSKLFKKDDLAVIERKVFNIVSNVYNYFVTYANNAKWEFSEEGWDEAKNSENVLDKWINTRLQQVVNISTQNTEDLNLFRTVRSIEEYINDLSTWYLRRSRNRVDSNFFATIFHNLIWLSKLMAPFAPFYAENLYRNLNLDDPNYPASVHLTDWPETKDLSADEIELISAMQEVRDVAELGNAVRKLEGVKLRQPLGAVMVSKKDDSEMLWSDELKQVLLDELNVKKFEETVDMVWKESPALKVGLNLEITSSLQLEGDIRELERAVQALRKEAGLKVGEPAKLYFKGDERLIEVLDKKRLGISAISWIGSMKKEVLKTSAIPATPATPATPAAPVSSSVSVRTEVEIGSGRVWLELEKV